MDAKHSSPKAALHCVREPQPGRMMQQIWGWIYDDLSPPLQYMLHGTHLRHSLGSTLMIARGWLGFPIGATISKVEGRGKEQAQIMVPHWLLFHAT